MRPVIFYPNAEDVLDDPSLQCYFRPLLSYECERDSEKYKIHLLGTDGLYCEAGFKYSENNFFGFDYNRGKYRFLGNIECFEGYDQIPSFYNLLKKDFEEYKNEYLRNKVTTSNYLDVLQNKLGDVMTDSLESLSYYAEAFYSYEFTKYYYQTTGKHQDISVLTESYGKNEDDFLLSESDAMNILDEFFINLEWNLQNDYAISKEMLCCATERYRFMSIIGGGTVFALLDSKNDKVYILEYFS